MTIVTDILQQMAAVSQPQRKFRAVLCATILAVRGRVNFRNLSRYCDYSERPMARQFRTAFDGPDFPQWVMNTALDPCAELIAVPAASFLPKSGKQTFGLGHFFNGCANRAERGVEISTVAVVEVTRRCAVTLAVAQTPPGADKPPSQQEEDESRGDFYKQQRREHRQRLPLSVTYHCVDGYFANKKYSDEVVALKLHPLTKLRGDANWLFGSPGPHPQRRGPKRQYDGKVNSQDLHRFESLGPLEEAPQVPLSTAIVWHVSLKRRLRVVVLVKRKDPTKPRSLVLAATALELDGRKLVEYSVARFQIEFLFRASQQFTALSDCQARAAAALDFHFNAALATLNLARAAEVRASSDPSPQACSMASWKPCHFNERLLDLFIESLALDPTWVKNHPCYDELRTYGAIAA